MKALVYSAPESLAYRDVPDPIPAHDEVLLRIARVGICGSDMHAFLGHDERRPAPLILGHEAAGTVVGGEQDGLRVTVNPLISCGACPACQVGRDNICPNRQIISMPPRAGAFAELLTMPVGSLVAVPAEVPLEQAVLAEPLACGWHAVRLARTALATATKDCRALVIGGGAVGLGVALCLAAQGIFDVSLVEKNPLRRNFLVHNCKQRVLAPDALASSQSFDVVIDAVGFAATREIASAQVRPGGVIMHIGLGAATGGLDIRRMTLQEVAFIGTYAYTAKDFRATAQAIFDGRMGDLDWIEQRSLADGQAAFADILNGTVPAPKITLQPN